MKSHREELTFNIPARMEFTNITRDVEGAVKRSGVKEVSRLDSGGSLFDTRADQRAEAKAGAGRGGDEGVRVGKPG